MKTFPRLKAATALFKYGIGAGFHSIARCLGSRDRHSVHVPGAYWYEGGMLDQEGQWK